MATLHPPYFLGTKSHWDDALQGGNVHNFYVGQLWSDIQSQNIHPYTSAFWQYLANYLYAI